MVLKDFQIKAATWGIKTAGTPVSYVTLDGVQLTALNSGSGEGFRIRYSEATGLGDTVSHLTVKDCVFENFYDGFIAERKPGSGATGTQFHNVIVTDTIFQNNARKGFYTEALSDAVFTDVQILNNGVLAPPTTLAALNAAGLELNLKDGDYANLTFNNLAVTGNGTGTKEGFGLGIKARTDGGYGTYPAKLSNVIINGGLFAGNERGIRIGEPGKDNAGPTGVSITGAVIKDNVQQYAGTDGSAYGGVVNMSLAAVDADRNYWGDASGPAGDGDDVFGNVDYIPYFTEAGKVNLAPYAVDLSSAEVAENTAVGFAVGTLSTTDDDTGDSFTYTLVAGAGDADNASFEIIGDTLKTVDVFDFEVKNSYSVRVQTSDNNGGLYAKIFTITVTDVAETPVLAPVGNQTADEDIFFTFTVTAFDSDGDPLTFTWTGKPEGATATPAGVFSWTPTQSDVGRIP